MRASFGWQIKAARVALGLTLDDVAAASGLNRNSVHRAENAPPRRMPVFASERITKVLEQQGACFSEFDGRAAVSMPNSQAGTH
jgi:hypothetical protein